MKTHRFLALWLIFLFCIAAISSTLAQEVLPAIVKKIEPSTVFILTYDMDGKILSQGSGFFISVDGDIVTNRHVLQGANRAEVKTADGKAYPLKEILAEDKEGDLIRCSVEIPRNAVRPLSVSVSPPEVGERVIVIGNPLGLERTVADGIVSAVREIPAFGKIIQISAPISPGSSGSPVVNMKGEVIGVATFQIVEGQNLNFAIPVERVTKLTPGKGVPLAEWGAGSIEEWRASAEGLYFTGLMSLWKEDYRSALPYFEEAVKKNPRYAEAHFQIGYCNVELGHHTEAIEAFKQIIRINPDYAMAHLGLGLAYYKLGRHTEAIESYKQAIRIKPDLAEAHYGLGMAYGELGRYTEAIESYKQAIRIKPDLAEAHYGLGWAYYKLGRYTEAIESYKQALRIKPEYVEAYYNLGVTYGKVGRYAEEIESYKQAIRINPDLADAHLNLGVAYGTLGQYTEAIEACKQAIRINPDYAKAHFGLGLFYGKLGRYTEAIESYKQAIRIKPDYVEAHFNLGVAYLLILGDRGSALDEYKILKDLDKDLANRLFNLIYK